MTSSAFLNALLSATELLQSAEQLAPDNVLRKHIHQAPLAYTSAIAEAAPRCVVREEVQ